MAAMLNRPARLADSQIAAVAQRMRKTLEGTDAYVVLDQRRRVRSFRGHKLLEWLQEPSNAKLAGLSIVDGKVKEADALAYAGKLLNYVDPDANIRVFAAAEVQLEKNGRSKRENGLRVMVPVDPSRSTRATVYDASEDARYFMVYEGSTTRVRFFMALLLGLVFLICLYPIWPSSARVFLWYGSVTLLLAIIGLSLLQLVVYFFAWLAGFELWIVPNLWADVSPLDIFKPMYTVRKVPGSATMRIVSVAVLVALGYWVSQQETSFDEFVAQQRKVVEDLYAGNLLSDTATSGGEGAAEGRKRRASLEALGYGRRRGPHIPSVEEWEKLLFEETAGAAEAGAGAAAEPEAEAGAEADAAAAGDL